MTFHLRVSTAIGVRLNFSVENPGGAVAVVAVMLYILACFLSCI